MVNARCLEKGRLTLFGLIRRLQDVQVLRPSDAHNCLTRPVKFAEILVRPRVLKDHSPPLRMAKRMFELFLECRSSS